MYVLLLNRLLKSDYSHLIGVLDRLSAYYSDKSIHYITGEYRQAIFTGLVEAGRDSSGDRIFFYLGHEDEDFVNAFYFDHESSELRYYAGSLNTLALELEINLREYEDYCEDFEVDEEENKNTLLKLEALLEKLESEKYSGKMDSTAIEEWYKRSHWLIASLSGEVCYDFEKEVKASPDFSIWETEKKKIKEDPRIFYYWLIAHYLLGNTKSCSELVEYGLSGSMGLAKIFANAIADCLNSPETGFGRHDARLMKKLRDKTQRHTGANYFEAGHPLG